MTVLHYLLKQQLIPKEKLLLAEQSVKSGSLINYLARNKILSADLLVSAASEIYHLPIKDLHDVKPHPESLSLLPQKMILTHSILPIQHSSHSCDVAMSDPGDLKTIETIQFMTGLNVTRILVNYEHLQTWIHRYTLEEHHPPEPQKKSVSSIHDSPTQLFIDDLLKQASQEGVSDIHIEFFETYCRIRFRQNGLLYEISKLTKKQAVPVVTRLKLLGALNISEKRIPQDGHFKIHTVSHRSMDIRISSCPTLYGEKLVLRLLHTEKEYRSMDHIDLFEKQKKDLLQALAQPYGLILVTGPTGSGKTVTLYSLLSHLNTIEKNIVTIEDPVEIYLPGINQVNINLKAGLTFASILRAFLRQDPDIIMIGEIRDFETAEIAIRAAQTGRLVLSTLHTPSALGAITRLKNMGIEPYNLASAITLVSAQRLIRKLCSICKLAYKPSKTLAELIGWNCPDIAYRAIGCSQCQNGYNGRLAIHEIIPMNEELISDEILSKKRGKAIQPSSVIQTLQQSALEHIKQGVTSIEEILRVIPFYQEQPQHDEIIL